MVYIWENELWSSLDHVVMFDWMMVYACTRRESVL